MSPMVFEILIALKNDAHNADGILTHIEELGGEAPAVASFYRTLKRASDTGYVRVVVSTGDGGPGRPPQRYRITRLGRAALEVEARRLGRLARLALSSSDGSGSGT